MLQSFFFWRHRQKRIPVIGTKGLGVWITKDSLATHGQYNYGEWFIVGSEYAEFVLQKIRTRPVFALFSYRDLYKVERFLWQHRDRINLTGVVVVYSDRTIVKNESHVSLADIYATLRSQNRRLGVVVLSDPVISEQKFGISYGEAKKFCDFIMPTIYCQFWDRKPSTTRSIYKKTLKCSSVPVVPIVACKTTKPPTSDLTRLEFLDNYDFLGLPSFVLWNVESIGVSFWKDAQRIVKRGKEYV